ncbi:hypothetical protein V5799_023779 [Amblyomma americanum]|uniref:RING-CH-type domain-containing protein n=1 Tax=Amblyomma americanum TaxID=6943 RepID=A0AAQ4FIA6_AMBAM
MRDAPHAACMPAQPTQPNGHSSHQYGIQEQAESSCWLRRKSTAGSDDDDPVFQAPQSCQSSPSLSAFPGTEHQRASRHSVSAVELSPSRTPDDDLLSTTSSTEHEKESPRETGAVEPNYALFPPSSPEVSGAERNPLWSGRASQIPAGLFDETESTAPVCRICHDEEGQEPLLSMCKCSGSIGLVHAPCLERWLNVRNTDDCELCHHRFPTTTPTHYRSLVRFYHWLQQCETNTKLSLLLDFLLFTLVPLFFVLFSLLSITSRTQRADENTQETDVAQRTDALFPPSNPEESTEEPNATWTSTAPQTRSGLPTVMLSAVSICRICNEGDKQQPLVSFCRCTGSLALVHVFCLELQLNLRNDYYCEFCHHRFPTTTANNVLVLGLYHWFLQCEEQMKWDMFQDLLLFPLLAVLLCYVSLWSASLQVFQGRTFLAGFLRTFVMAYIATFTTMFLRAARSYYSLFRSWQIDNPVRRFLEMPPTSAAGASRNSAAKQASSLLEETPSLDVPTSRNNANSCSMKT